MKYETQSKNPDSNVIDLPFISRLAKSDRSLSTLIRSQILTILSLSVFPLIVIFTVSRLLFAHHTGNLFYKSGTYQKRSETIVNAQNCSAQKIAEILAPATSSLNYVNIDCNVILKPGDVVTKTMVFAGAAANGVSVDCAGARLNGANGTVNETNAMVVVKSVLLNDGLTWDRPENVKIKNCNIIGSVSVDGMGGITVLRRESRKAGYVEKARNSAPKNIILDNVSITSTGAIPLYIYDGVTNFSLLNSEITGKSNSVAIYLDAESSGNIIENNYIDVATSREVIAIDASGNNIIRDNWFSGLSNGGIYLYRNCGEQGVIRHSTPSHNAIVNNVFYYNKYRGVYYINNVMFGNPTIYIASRNGDDAGAGYCGDDKGYPFGSSESDLDYAMYNVVMQNQIYKLSPALMITGRNVEVNSPNYIDYNETVSVANQRRAGCYVTENGYQKDFIVDGQSIEVLGVGQGDPTSYNYTCNDGDLTHTTQNSKVTRLVFDCGVDGDNNGCNKTISCPAGQKIIGATAAADLENNREITEEQMGSVVPTNNIQVLRPSDDVSDGSAYIGAIKIQKGRKVITGVDGLNSVTVGCKEHDANGGDCHIKAILYCRQFNSTPLPPVIENKNVISRK